MVHSYICTHMYRMYMQLYICILQDLSKYQNDELLHESLHLLGRYFSAEENLFEKAIQTQVNNCMHCVPVFILCSIVTDHF